MHNYEKIEDFIFYIENNFLRLLFKLFNDKISNVRINCASSLINMKKYKNK